MRLFLLSLILATLSCGGRPDAWEAPLDVTGPLTVGRYLAYLDRTRERVILVRPYLKEVRAVGVGKGPAFMQPTPDLSRLLVLCQGKVAQSRDEVDQRPTLHVIEVKTGQKTVHSLGSPFDRVAVSDDNRYGIAYFSQDSDLANQEVFRNPNAIAILDLDDPDAPPLEKTVRSFGDVPLGVVFSPPTMASLTASGGLGPERTMAVIFAQGYVTFQDVTHPERSEVTVHLTMPDSEASLTPEEVVFAPEAGTAFLRASGTDDVYAFTFMDRPPEDDSSNDFVISINTLAAGADPGDVAVFMEGPDRKILVANRSSHDLTVIDALTAEFVTIDVGHPVDTILTYPSESPTLAVITSQATLTSMIHFLDLAGVEANRGRNLSTLTSAEPVVRLEMIPNSAQALVIHDHDLSVMSVLDLSQRTLTPITAQGSLKGYAITSTGDVLAGFTGSALKLGIVNLQNLSTRSLALLGAPQGVYTVALGPGEEADKEAMMVVVDHGDESGLLTVILSPEGDRESTFMLSGFLLQGVLDDRL